MAVESEWCVPGYEHVEELGRGGFGRVVLARRVGDGAPVAVKYLAARLVGDERFRAEFRREARVLVDLQCSYTARLYEYLESVEAPGAAIVMEYVPGASLRRLLQNADGAAMPPEAALGVLKGSLLGLGAAHQIGVVHRDYKPENVLVRPEGASVLVDFGIAVRAGDASAEIIGTPPYMAPEQFVGAPPSAAADVYAATAVFFECVTGSRPVDLVSSGMDSWADAHRAGRVPVELAPEPVRGLIGRGLAKDPAARPAQALAFAEELERVAAASYGPGWEARGWQVLAGALSGMAAAGVLLSLLPGLAGSGVPLPVALPPPTMGPVPGTLPPPTFGPVPGTVPPPTMGPVPSSIPPSTPGPIAGPPPHPGFPSAPQNPYPRPRIPGRHLLRHATAKLGAAKTAALATVAVTATAGVTAVVVTTTTAKPSPHPPVAAVSASLTSSAPVTSPTPAATVATSTPAALNLGPLADTWIAHFGVLTIAADGTFTVKIRDINGGPNDTLNAEGHLTSADGTSADGVVTKTQMPEPDGVPLGPVHITYVKESASVDFIQGKVDMGFCSHASPVGYCGA
ncbi:MAG: protein kinase [Catenulispora sp.]|nr:protein kinase [Catenulispora sp.]